MAVFGGKKMDAKATGNVPNILALRHVAVVASE
jgi:hypothetical protein